jgi:sarcosine oxidase subunit alpha
VSVVIDGRTYEVREGDSVAAALLVAGLQSPYCMAGACFACRVTVEGLGSVQGCLVNVAEGMRIATQRGPRELPR